MKYEVIFTTGYNYDSDYLQKELRCDVLILDDKGNYYNPQFITLDRIKAEFGADSECYLEDNLVILHIITTDAILTSIPQLHKWLFQQRWVPVTAEHIKQYFLPAKDWEYVIVTV